MPFFGFFVGILETGRVVRFDEVPPVFVGGERKVDGKYFFAFGVDGRRDFPSDFEKFLWNVFDFRAEFAASCRDVASEFVSVFRVSDARDGNFSANVVEPEVMHSIDDARNAFRKILEFLKDVDHSQWYEGFFYRRVGELGSGYFSDSFPAVPFRRLENERLAFQSVAYVLIFEIFAHERGGGLEPSEREVGGMFVVRDFRDAVRGDDRDVRFDFGGDEIPGMRHFAPKYGRQNGFVHRDDVFAFHFLVPGKRAGHEVEVFDRHVHELDSSG